MKYFLISKVSSHNHMNGTSIHHSTSIMQSESLAHLVAHCMGRESITHLQEVTKEDCEEYWKLMGELADAQERAEERQQERKTKREEENKPAGWWKR